MRILIIEDDSRISNFIVKGLEEEGFSTCLATTGEEARDLSLEQQWDLVLMDIMLPQIDGLQLIKLMRFKRDYTPVIVMSALSQVNDKVAALDGGADDYMTKPFHFSELLARINALTRRAKFMHENDLHLIKCGSLTLNNDTHKVLNLEQELTLTPKEFKLLAYLMSNKNKVLSRSQILNAVWNINYDNNTNVVDVYISYLRDKIDKNRTRDMIRTVKGRGYIMCDE